MNDIYKKLRAWVGTPKGMSKLKEFAADKFAQKQAKTNKESYKQALI